MNDVAPSHSPFDPETDQTRIAPERELDTPFDATRLAIPELAKVEPRSEECIEPYAIGDRIGGRYEVLAINKGTMGVVYGTFDHQTGMARALKTLQRRFVGNANMRELFSAEAALWVRLEKHPFITRAYDIEHFDGLPYVVTEYIRGTEGRGSDLRSWLGSPSLTLAVAPSLPMRVRQSGGHSLL